MDYKVGDVVQLKSGSPNMTIDYILGSEINKMTESLGKNSQMKNGDLFCSWFDNSIRKKEWFNKETVKKVQ